MSIDQPPRVVRLDSARLRVLAHPLRSRLLAALRVYGPATSTGLAHRLSTNSGATSYHLRKLAEVGLVEEEKERGARRERWWQAAHDVTSWAETEFLDNPADSAAADWLLGHHTRTKVRWVDDWLASRHNWPLEWRNAADSFDFELRLNPRQLSALNHELHDVIDRYRTAEAEPSGDIERVLVLLDSFPSPQPRI